MSGNVRLTVTHPTPSGDQLPLKHVRCESRVDGIAEWTEVAVIPVAETSRLFPDLAAGLWHFRCIWVDELDVESVPVEDSIQVPSAPPSAGTLSLALE